MSDSPIVIEKTEVRVNNERADVSVVQQTVDVDLVGPGAAIALGAAERATVEANRAAAASSRVSTRQRLPDATRLFSLMDKNRREVGRIGLDGRLDINQTEVRMKGWTLKDRPRLEANTGKVAILSSNFRLLGYLDPDAAADVTSVQNQITAAARSAPNLAARLDRSLDAYGNLRHAFNHARLRRYHYLRARRTLATPEAAQNIIAAIGDSFTHAATRYTGPLAEKLIAEQGDAGGGYTGFAFGVAGTPPYVSGGSQPTLKNGNVRSTYGVTHVGSWTSTYGSVPSPDICCVNSSTPADRLVLSYPAAPVLSGARLFWIGTADGVMRYSWDSGATWATINVQGTVGACSFADLAGVPTSGVAGALWLEVVSGTCRPAGLDWRSAASGVRFHKLGATGSTAAQWATQAATASLKTAVAGLGANTFTVMHGTNDQGSNRTATQFSADLTTITTNLRTAIPAVDVAIIMPPENQRANSVAMPVYASVAAEVAAVQNCAYLDTQPDFGLATSPSEYGSAGAIPLFNADNVHPEPATGGRVLYSAIHRFLHL